MSGLMEENVYSKIQEFSFNVGVTPGYFHNNEASNEVSGVSKTWQETAEEVFEKTGVYVSAILQDGVTVYRKGWGCPDGGEYTFVFTGLQNPEFQPDLVKWRHAVCDVCRLMKEKLKQERAYLTFREVDFLYLK